MCGQVRTNLECFGVLLPPRLLLPICPPPQASRQLVIRLRIKRERRKAAFSHSGGSSHICLFLSVSGENAGCDGPLRGWPGVSPFCSLWPGSPSLFGL